MALNLLLPQNTGYTFLYRFGPRDYQGSLELYLLENVVIGASSF